MQIKINKNSVYALSEVLFHFSNKTIAEVESMQNNLTELNSYFLDPSYDSYSSEYMTAFQVINKKCEELQIAAKRVAEYSKKLSEF